MAATILSCLIVNQTNSLNVPIFAYTADKTDIQIAKPVFLPILTLPAEAQNYYYLEPQEFLQLFDTQVLENTTIIEAESNLFTNPAVSEYIYEKAYSRGYQLRSEAQNTLTSVEGARLQGPVATAWLELKKNAAKEGISLGIVSGFRSVSDQKSIFLQRFQAASLRDHGRLFNDQEILNGTADSVIDTILSTTSVPGTSKHHTGYTLDITDTSSTKDFTLFDTTNGYSWISENNYFNLKRFGFIPSYPEGGSNMGPDPESWEIVWVGSQHLQL